MRQLLHVLRQNDSIKGSPSPLETSLARRLQAAYILRGQPVFVGCKSVVSYIVIPELSVFQVISQTSTRCWGSTEDLQELTDNIEQWFPSGIIVLHHRLQRAFIFAPRKALQMWGFKRALGYAKTKSSCLCLAHITVNRGVAFAQVHVEHTDQKWKRKVCVIQEFVFQQVMCVPLPCMMDRRAMAMRSAASTSRFSR